jgi:signal transduction histidine kinase
MKIFISSFSLRFRIDFIEKSYIEDKLHRTKKYNLPLIILGTIFAIFSVLCFLTKVIMSQPNVRFDYKVVFYFTIILACMYLIIIPSQIIFISCLKTQKYLNAFNYLLIVFSFMFIKSSLLYTEKIDYGFYSFIWTLELLTKLLWIILGLLDFPESLYLSFLDIISNIIFISLISNLWEMSPFIYLFISLNLLLFLCLSYSIIMERRKSFYFLYNLETKCYQYETTLMTFKSGFLLIADQEIKFINNSMMELLNKNKDHFSLTLDSERNYMVNTLVPQDKYYHVLVYILSQIINENDSTAEYSSLQEITNVLREKFLSNDNNKFHFLCYRELKISKENKETKTFEIYCKCYPDQGDKSITLYEFIFNDATLIKDIERRKTELKFKNIFLSKIAHEFKNPLICINELVEQECDKPRLNDDELSNLSLIKSLSQYLLILIKDLDFFSSRGNKYQSKISKNRVEMNLLINFTQNITKGLLMKFNKISKIKFSVFRSKNLPEEFYSDEVKLKQILVNLLSNSIKYSNVGHVILRFSLKYNNYLEICIEDTGIGMTDNQINYIKRYFKEGGLKMNKNTNLIGLGLPIIYELTSLLGKTIQFESNFGKGSRFWFSIPCVTGVLNKSDFLDKKKSNTFLSLLTLNKKDGINSLSISRKSMNSEYPPTETKIFIGKMDNLNLEFSNNSHSNLNSSHYSQYVSDIGSFSKPSFYNISKNIKKEYNFIIADDDYLIRQASIRVISKLIENLNITINFIEANDGIETLHSVYVSLKNGKSIHCILSDQTMELLEGTQTAKLFGELRGKKNIPYIPFFLLTAYENFEVLDLKIESVFCKPFNNQMAESLLRKIGVI